MENINKIKILSIWIFIVPFVAINACLILITQFHQFFDLTNVVLPSIPYIDGGTSISRTARVFPTYLIFKPAMFITAFFLVKYWRYNFNVMEKINPDLNYKKFLSQETKKKLNECQKYLLSIRDIDPTQKEDSVSVGNFYKKQFGKERS